MEVLGLPEIVAVEDCVSIEVLWKLALIIISAYWIKVLFGQVYFFKNWFEEYTTKPNLKYELLIAKLENLNSKIEQLQTTNESQLEALVELKKKSDELREDLFTLRMRVSTVAPAGSTATVAAQTLERQNQAAAVLAASAATLTTSEPTGGPPPPPPPPPPFSLFTPTIKIAPPSSVKTDQPKKKPQGPPQFSISQADITKVLQKLRKTSSTARLLGTSQPRKTPPRRKLFQRTPGLSRRRSITSLSPGGDLSRHKTPLSSASPPDENGNGCDYQE